MKILIVDDEPLVLSSIKLLLRRRGLPKVTICDNGIEAVEKIKNNDFDIVLLDYLMPELDGLQVLEKVKPFCPNTEFIILTAVDDVATAVKAIRLGSFDYLVKPIDNERLLLTMERAYEHLGLLAGLAGSGGTGKPCEVPEPFSEIISQDPRMLELLTFARIMGNSGNPVLITGESGTGKELLARGLHKVGPGSGGPFIAVNVSAIPESLFESQFFGHARGTFTGAERDHKGFFEQADGGTLFLDEIGELPMRLQSKLLRVLEDKMVIPVGATQPIPVRLQIVSATNIDMQTALQEGSFRLDLLCRLKSAHVHLPPLRERTGDIPLLAEHFLRRACEKHHKTINGFSPEAMDQLYQKDYPGNIRSLAQEIENAVILCDSDYILGQNPGWHQEEASPSSPPMLCSLKEIRNKHVIDVLNHTGGDRKQAARILGVTLRHVQRILSQIKADQHLEEK
ncbi:sigma-54-dependent transcriptional regulator [Desulforhopalus singaporensis]|uniref:Two-component system, NtrC family, response regulator HydG n=1 Tax=Desulforhopalus singaporensis TaxID=91360 RepID=A0A1H0U271_9BACT|nr:sigma-54 dependent transcriptional regulator [Desulforhopalus singaporensis]SDP60150.1 two-component system, NtrC family, response regulator HydG [Desulforhopalus singaporensis]